jgi:hypothetical protein
MESVEGETLEKLIRRSGRLEIKLALQIVSQVATGDSVAFKKLAGVTDTATRMQLQAEIRRKVKSITFNFRGHLLDTPEFPAGKHVVAWIEFVNGAKRAMTFTPDHIGVFWVHGEHETPAGPPEAWGKK